MEAHASSSSSSCAKTTSHQHQLHAVTKPTHKPWRSRPVAAPLPPNPTRVYKVRPIEFKDVVQKLTGAPEFQPSRLRTVAPAPLDVGLGGVGHRQQRQLPAPAEVKAGRAAAESHTSPAVGFALSPGSNAWCSFLLSSPGSIPGLDLPSPVPSGTIK
uniref:VQ domain-containing protein n=1 Tax=Kalanchoe fedtschenkoi TaxID=63787 RepID=A0A7N0T4Z9_KALFE